MLVDDEELEFSANHIARRARRSLEGYDRNPMYGKIKTLHDLVMFFHHQPPGERVFEVTNRVAAWGQTRRV